MEINLLVSVIIPVFNVSQYLTEALESVINQTYRRLEIIIVDDGSTDGSSEICDEYEKIDDRVFVIHQSNKGLSSARNAGLHIMQGDVVAFLDPDDKFHVDFISNMLFSLVRNNAELVICKNSVHYTTEEIDQADYIESFPSISKGIYSKKDILQALVSGSINHNVWNKIYKRTVWENICFPDGHVYEDIDTIYRVIASCDKIVVLNETLYCRRKRPGSITQSMSWKNSKDKILAHTHFNSFVEYNTPMIFSDKLLKESRTNLYNQMVCHYLLYSIKREVSEKKEYSKRLRSLIIEIGDKLDSKNFSLKRRVLHAMICNSWPLLKIVYPLYIKIKRLLFL